MEGWEQIPGYEDRYEVSDLGRIRSVKTGALLRFQKMRRMGYLRVTLTHGSRRSSVRRHRTHKVHSLV